MNRASMDRFIDTIEWIAAGFVGIVALDIFLSVLLRNTLNPLCMGNRQVARPSLKPAMKAILIALAGKSWERLSLRTA